MLTAEEMGQPR